MSGQSFGTVGQQGAGTLLNIIDLLSSAGQGQLGQTLLKRQEALQDPTLRENISSSPLLASFLGHYGRIQPTAVDLAPGGPSAPTPERRFQANLPPLASSGLDLSGIQGPYSVTVDPRTGQPKSLTLRSDSQPNQLEFDNPQEAQQVAQRYGYNVIFNPGRGGRGRYSLQPPLVTSPEEQMAGFGGMPESGQIGPVPTPAPRALGTAPPLAPSPVGESAGTFGTLRPRRVSVGGSRRQADVTYESPPVAATDKFAEFAAANGVDVRDPNTAPAIRKSIFDSYNTANLAFRRQIELTKSMGQTVAGNVAGWRTFQQLTTELRQDFSDEEINRYAGTLQQMRGRVGAIAGGVQSFFGFDPTASDPRFVEFYTRLGAIRAAVFDVAGKQMTPTEALFVKRYVPQGDEAGGPQEFLAKLTQFPELSEARVQNILATQGLSRGGDATTTTTAPPSMSPTTTIDPARLEAARRALRLPAPARTLFPGR